MALTNQTASVWHKPLVNSTTKTSLGRLALATCFILGAGLIGFKAANETTQFSAEANVPIVAEVVALDVGEYRAQMAFAPSKKAPRIANVTLRDQAGQSVAGKPVTGILTYLGVQPGHEHKDILISRETSPGSYQLSLEEVISGAWLLTIAVGNEARVAYPFVVD